MFIDAHAELVRRLAPFGPDAERHVALALYLSRALQYLADLRPFADWVSRGRRYGARAGTPPVPPAPRPEVRLLTRQAGIRFDLCNAVAQAYLDATDHGVTAAEFQTSSNLVERAMHRLMVDFEFVRPRPRNRELDYLRNGLAFALRTWFGEAVGPTIMALTLIAYGEDPPIPAPLNQEAVADEIAARASSYSTIWQRQARAVRRVPDTYLVIDGTPPAGEIVPGVGPIVLLGDGRSIVRRPTHIPAGARPSFRHRRGKTALVAKSRCGPRVRTQQVARRYAATKKNQNATK